MSVPAGRRERGTGGNKLSSKEKNAETIRKILTQLQEIRDEYIGHPEISGTHIPPTCSGRSDSETIMNGASRFPSDIDFAELIPTVVRRVRDNRSAGSQCRSAMYSPLSIRSRSIRDTTEQASGGDWPWSLLCHPVTAATALFIGPRFITSPTGVGSRIRHACHL